MAATWFLGPPRLQAARPRLPTPLGPASSLPPLARLPLLCSQSSRTRLQLSSLRSFSHRSELAVCPRCRPGGHRPAGGGPRITGGLREQGPGVGAPRGRPWGRPRGCSPAQGGLGLPVPGLRGAPGGVAAAGHLCPLSLSLSERLQSRACPRQGQPGDRRGGSSYRPGGAGCRCGDRQGGASSRECRATRRWWVAETSLVGQPPGRGLSRRL